LFAGVFVVMVRDLPGLRMGKEEGKPELRIPGRLVF
jgi:hypothetical protein